MEFPWQTNCRQKAFPFRVTNYNRHVRVFFDIRSRKPVVSITLGKSVWLLYHPLHLRVNYQSHQVYHVAHSSVQEPTGKKKKCSRRVTFLHGVSCYLKNKKHFLSPSRKDNIALPMVNRRRFFSFFLFLVLHMIFAVTFLILPSLPKIVYRLCWMKQMG